MLSPPVRIVNVIQRPDRLSSLEASVELAAMGFEPVLHLVVRGRERRDVANELRRAAEAGIRNVLCLLGDHPVSVEPREGLKVREAVALACELIPDAFVGATLNQYVEPFGRALRNLLPKLRAGARWVQTQPVFDLDLLRGAVEALRTEEASVYVVAMVMPLASAETAEKMEARLGVRLPEAARRQVEAGGGWELFAETVQVLHERRLVDGLAVMTFEMDPSPSVGDRVRELLVQAGAVAR